MKGEYGQSQHGNFKVTDVMSVPHPYCVGAKHVAYASDHHGGILGESAIEAAERQGIHCETCLMNARRHGKHVLSLKEHEQVLVVTCSVDFVNENKEPHPELHEYLLNIKDEAVRNGYVGFAFMKE